MEAISNILNFSEYLFWFVIVFSLIVFVHEYGHYYIARINGVKIDKFSIGFGPSLISKRDKHGTIWQVSLLPLGGYVKFAGEMYYSQDTKSNDKDDKTLFFNKSSLQKASIVLAGPIANFILAIFIFIIIFSFFGRNYIPPVIGSIDPGSPASKSKLNNGDVILSINNKKIETYDEVYELLDSRLYEKVEIKIDRNGSLMILDLIPQYREIKSFIGSKKKINYLGINPQIRPLIGKILDNSAAKKSKLKKNDLIIGLEDKKVNDIREVISKIKESPNKTLNLTIKRNDEILYKQIKPSSYFDEKGNEEGRIGVTFARERIKLSLYEAVIFSFKSFLEVVKKTLIAFSEIIFGKRDHCEVGGPILIAKVSNDIAKSDLISFAGLIALISINLGIINLFPLPLLDGGHFFTYIYEFFKGKRVKYQIYRYIQFTGIFIIGALMVFSIANDIYCRVLI